MVLWLLNLLEKCSVCHLWSWLLFAVVGAKIITSKHRAAFYRDKRPWNSLLTLYGGETSAAVTFKNKIWCRVYQFYSNLFAVLYRHSLSKTRSITEIDQLNSCFFHVQNSNAHCLKNYKIPMEKNPSKWSNSWSLKFGLTSLWNQIQKIGATASVQTNPWF